MPTSPSQVFEPLPRHAQFPIGARYDGQDASTFTPIVGIIKREAPAEASGTDSPVAHPRTLYCLARNHGDAAFTLAVEDSANNNLANVPGQPAVADAYAARSIRVDGADVGGGTLVVQPGGAAVFLVEWPLADDDYIKFEVDDEAAHGDLTVAHFGGALTTRDREEVP